MSLIANQLHEASLTVRQAKSELYLIATAVIAYAHSNEGNVHYPMRKLLEHCPDLADEKHPQLVDRNKLLNRIKEKPWFLNSIVGVGESGKAQLLYWLITTVEL